MIRITSKEELRAVLEKLEREGFEWKGIKSPTWIYDALAKSLDEGEIIINRINDYDIENRRSVKLLSWCHITQANEYLNSSNS